MSMNEKGVYRITINAPIERVWQEITRTDQVIKCFFGSRLDTPGLEVGAPIRMRTRTGKYTGVVGEVLEWEPPRLFSHTFKFTQLDESPVKVTYRLEEVDSGIEFTMILERIVPGTDTEKYMVQGTDFILKTLKAVSEDRRLPLKCWFILFMCYATERSMKKEALSENWPFERQLERIE